MNDCLANPLQSEDNDVRVDLRPAKLYPDAPNAQSVTFPDGTVIPLLYDGVLPYIPIRRPLPEEIDKCKRLVITSKYDWDPYGVGTSFSKVHTNTNINSVPSIISSMESTDPISNELSCSLMNPIIELTHNIIDINSAVSNPIYFHCR